MQIDNGGGSGAGTWGAYAVDGDGDGRTDIYDPDDAIAAAARYVRANGAPADWQPRAVRLQPRRLVRRSCRSPGRGLSRGRGAVPPSATLPTDRLASGSPRSLASPASAATRASFRRSPSSPAAYGVRVTDCFGGRPHDLGGEHPLGLATDLVPVDGDWNRTARLAGDFGWSPACARAGCPRPWPVSGDPLQRLPGSRRSAPQHQSAPPPVLEPRPRCALLGGAVGPHGAVRRSEPMTRPVPAVPSVRAQRAERSADARRPDPPRR